ncbi:MAG TPA: NAD(P)/FAD-dependent oxidoreductase [Nitrososphaeraceae archaeon]|nr:NAD(P)/FAD-dependent oxidoreductase [Nitrososphaeraceae archaeon]
MKEDYDVIVAGGSVSGLLAAREIASRGHSVLVLEEDSEIGTPEHCGGLVSISAVGKLGILPRNNVIQNQIKAAKICSPSRNFEINAVSQKVVVLERREFDKQIALQSTKLGANIRTKCSLRDTKYTANSSDKFFGVMTTDGLFRSRYFVDARGISSLIQNDRSGVLLAAQYEVYARWIEKDTVIVEFDNVKYPGFFAWIIPTGEGSGKVGVAGKSINTARSITRYLESKGSSFSVIRRIFAPIWVKGPIDEFINGRTVVIGDAAGQTKPTTAGGIYTCGLAGILAGRAISKAIESKNDDSLIGYPAGWTRIFGKEFRNMVLFRKLLERLDNNALDQMFSNIKSTSIDTASKTGDFDFHAVSIRKILSATGLKILKTVIGNESRRLF